MTENEIYTEKKNGLTIKIFQDDNPQSPEEWGDDSLFLVADHRDFYVTPPKNSTTESVVKDYNKTHHVFGLEAYIHSGVVLALSREGNFPDRQWDVSQLGAVFVGKKDYPAKAQARKAALGLIESWNDALAGNVYGYVVEDERKEHIDSCWGFYGDYDKSGILDQARLSLKQASTKEENRKRAEAYKKDDIQRAENLVKPYGMQIA